MFTFERAASHKQEVFFLTLLSFPSTSIILASFFSTFDDDASS
jgi:hypothetical protein